MSALAINSLLEGPVAASVTSRNTVTPATRIVGSTFMDRKHYSGSSGGYHHSESQEHSGSSYGQHKSRSIALTALTLLAFLFFLNILQQCLQDQMDQMNPQVVIMQARIQAAREAEAKLAAKEAEKRIGTSPSNDKDAAKNDRDSIKSPPFKRPEDLYHYDKVHVPVKIKQGGYGRL